MLDRQNIVFVLQYLRSTICNFTTFHIEILLVVTTRSQPANRNGHSESEPAFSYIMWLEGATVHKAKGASVHKN